MMGIEFDRSRMQNIQIMLFGRQCAASSSAFGIVIVQLNLLNGGIAQSNKADKRSQHFAVTASVCRKTSFVDKKGVAGAEPPTGTRGGSPSKIPLSRGKGAGG